MGKVLKMARGKNVEIESDLYDTIVPTIEKATGIKPSIRDFVNKAVRKALEEYGTHAGQKEKKGRQAS